MNTIEAIKAEQFEGFTDELSNEEYHQSPGTSSSGFKEFLKSPAHFKAYMLGEKKQTQPMYHGEKFHSQLLEGKNVVAAPKCDRRTNEGKALYNTWLEKNKEGQIYDWFSTPDANLNAVSSIQGMSQALRKKESFKRLTKKGIAERSFYVRDGITGLYLKARTDWLTQDQDGHIILDVKTTCKSAKPDSFERTIFDYGYHISLAWYCRVLSQVLGKVVDTCLLVAVEKNAPFESCSYLLKEDALNLGHQIINQKLEQFAECMQKDEWPGYGDEIKEVGIPDWAMNRQSLILEEGEAA